MYLNKRKGSRPGTIIMLHGNSSSSRIYNSIFESQIEYSLVSYDFYGHGKSEANGKYNLKSLKDQLFSIIDTIDDEILLVGHSLGGHIVMEIASEIKNLKGIIIFGSPPLTKPIRIEDVYHAVPEIAIYFSASPSHSEIEKAISKFSNNESVNHMIIEDYVLTDKVAREVFAAQTNDLSDELEILNKLECPKFILHGDKDPIVRKDYLEENRAFGGYELIIIKESGHYIPLEKPDQFNNMISQISTNIFED